ncbi:MFS transporter [Colwellia sp. MEBiC06753]
MQINKLHITNFSRLSHSYFWYFAVLGLMMPFLAVFLEGRGFNSLATGEILAIFMGTKIFGPMFWAFLADKSGKQLTIIQFSTTCALICFIGLFFVDGYWSITLFLGAFSLFWTGMLPQLEVLTLNSMRNSAKFYARIRLWGSIGFIALAMASSEIIAEFGSESFISIGFSVLLGLWLSSLLLHDKKATGIQQQTSEPIFPLLLALPFIVFFVAGILLQISFGPYYSFFALYIRDLGYPAYMVGVLIGVSVVAEVLIFILAGRVFKRFSVQTILVFSFIATSFRWLIMAYFGEQLVLLIVVQLLHAASYGLYHSASLQYLHQHFKPSQYNRAQAIYISGVYGVGGALGAYLSGVLWADGQGVVTSYVTASLLALIGGILALAMSRLLNKR